MATLHAGTKLAESEIDLVRDELDRFNRLAGPHLLKQLTEFIRTGRTAVVRAQIFVADGRVTKVQIQPDYTITLDAPSGE
jgi:hypothetical protein